MNYMGCYFVIITGTFFMIWFRTGNTQLYEGDTCELENKERGKCVRFSQCPSAIETVQRREQPIACSFIRFTPFVCCPVPQAITSSITSRLSEQNCQMFKKIEFTTTPEPPTRPFNVSSIKIIYLNTDTPSAEVFSESPLTNDSLPDFDYNSDLIEPVTEPVVPKLQISEINLQPGTVYEGINNVVTLAPDFDYDLSAENESSSNETSQVDYSFDYSTLNNDSTLIVLGTIAKIDEFPHMAAIGFTSGNKQLWRCGGTLVSEKFVLTAAHCLSSADYGLAEWVSLGSNYVNLIENDPPYPQQQIYQIIRRIPHPKYKRPSSYNDIALLELNQTVEFSRSVRPACLHASSEVDPQVQLTATGWGLTQFGGNGSESLQKVLLDIYQAEECLKIYEDIGGTRRLKSGIVREEQFCAGGRQGEQDTCQGDSGGPLQLKVDDINGGTYSIIGVTSFGKSCGLYGIPGVYTRISQYLPWLEDIIWSNDF